MKSKVRKESVNIDLRKRGKQQASFRFMTEPLVMHIAPLTDNRVPLQLRIMSSAEYIDMHEKYFFHKFPSLQVHDERRPGINSSFKKVTLLESREKKILKISDLNAPY